ncbi:protease [Pontibacillus halophilus JSM 076056 = DSM 19796]|uniref:Protease n=1 Tax=Pontibacillus halophilus JSM 076056 = DSM 19796 TaxID=1385510 RepID=A0A0A5GM58_9BACI|nr:immune inhibitor A domain-containing protein [Pontibacillus halophilus]KGX93034.1 protease [Pontibacillus halophilus JSM 076056 = DSM 19796]
MRKNKVLSMAMIAALGLGAAMGPVSNVTASTETPIPQVEKKEMHHSGPFDLAIANEEKLIEMLKKSGKIAKDASATEAEKVVREFLKQKEKGLESFGEEGELEDDAVEIESEVKEKLSNGIGNHTHKKGNNKSKKNLVPVQEEAYDGEVREDNVLVLLIEFPDFPHNSIQPGESDMYYEDYVKEHYEDMIFGDNGYEGPNGEQLVSMKQYYEEQTNGAYTIDGTIAGWYTASRNAAAYGGNDPARGDNDRDARSLVKEALDAAAADPNVNLADFDQEDRYDLDGDGNKREADGLVDHLMVVHSAVGEEAGGGQLGEDAIWSHRWNLGGSYSIAGSPTPEVDYWGNGTMYAYDYTIEPADGAAGVFAHEYAHDLGLPDEYDTQYTGAGEPVAYWSLMSSGSWAGDIPGTEPTGFSAWSKEFLQASHGGNWLKYDEVDLEDIDNKGFEMYLDQANTKGTNPDALRINLPDKATKINEPFEGEYEFFSGSGDNLNNSLSFNVDLSNAKSSELSFKAWYDIETDWDYASVQVSEDGQSWTTVPGNITTTSNPNGSNPGDGITGNSNGWVDANFDLSQYRGKSIQVKINYSTDAAVSNPGLYVDNIVVSVDGSEVLTDGAEGESKVNLEGFTQQTGTKYTQHYYLLEWRNHEGVDEGLGHIRRGESLMSYDPGLVIWYADNKYTENWTGAHPGEGFLGVVDADQKELFWSDGSVASTRYQIHDAAFSLRHDEKLFVDYTELLGLTLEDKRKQFVRSFNDKKSYRTEALPDAGRNIPTYGLKIEVTGESKDRSVGRVEIKRK